MIKIEDVAKLAGVSSMTVSRVINNSGYVKQQTRDIVEEAIKQLNYSPNMVAKSLVTKRTNILAYIVSDISDPFYNKVSKGIAESCINNRFSFIICDATNQNILDNQIAMLNERQIDGVIFHDLNISQSEANKLLNSGRKIIMLENEQDLSNVYSIWGNDKEGAKIATNYLISIGHRKIACLKGPTDKNYRNNELSFQDSFKRRTWINRTAGYEEALQEAGIDFRMFFDGCVESMMGFRLAQNFINEWLNLEASRRPSAIYCESDILAFGVLSKAIESGIRVPHELAIIGHDGLDMTTMTYPQISTIRQQRFQMGRLSADMLIDFIIHGQKEGSLVLNQELFIGQTT
ncbi:MAG: LacI family DNA-binding transcriptional regulator [Sphaerochaetaceae bacterium]